MEKLYNPTYQRWEVISDNPKVINGEEQAVFVSPDEDACDAYMTRVDKNAQYQTILKLIEKNGYVDRWMAAVNGVMELAARICEMEGEGIRFIKTVEKEYHKDGSYKGWHKVYSL